MIERISKEAIGTRFKASCDQVLSTVDPYSRSTTAGHITASGLVVRDGRVLLIFHPYIKAWMQPGGHIDEGESPIDAAIREVFEETGIACKPIDEYLDPIDIDLHEIPANPKKAEGVHLHIDLLFVFKAIEERESPESIEKAWVPFDQITCPRIQRALQNLS
ncbi:NUDIX domain-containing protein [Polynucleobacter sp. CS-Odin-A6]|nr:NUDIX domain-containing protein [Polynucleobacter sp. CS-Odin-A6]